MTKPVVAIVGRPNVGKSTLFNRLIGERRAIVEDVPGTTRDRLYGDTDWNGREFIVVDTAGLEIAPESELVRHVQDQVSQAIAEADVIVFLTDVRSGLNPMDLEVADRLRRSGKPIVIGVNKSEGPKWPLEASEFYALGLSEPIPVSGLQGQGVGDLLDAVVEVLPSRIGSSPETDGLPKFAIIGRPNVGKSSFLNKVIGVERSVVSETPGTTRDTIDTIVTIDGRKLVLVDTAGVRRRGRVEQGIEKYSVMRALRAINRCDVVLLLIDAVEGVTAQDTHVASYAIEAAKGTIVVVNKWDLIEKDTYTADEYTARVREAFKFLPDPPVIFTSALTGQRVRRVLAEALTVYDARQERVPTGRLNQVIAQALDKHAPANVRGRRLKVYYATQPEVSPPTFVFFVNDPKIIHFSYERYLENQLRAAFGFAGTPIRLLFRRREGEEPK